MSNALVDLLDELLDGGAVVHGDVTIALAGVDLISLDLRLLLCSVLTLSGAAGGDLARPVDGTADEAAAPVDPPDAGHSAAASGQLPPR
jgi:hypothetical protein